MYLNKLITKVKQRKREKKQLLNPDINGKLMVKFLSYTGLPPNQGSQGNSGKFR